MSEIHAEINKADIVIAGGGLIGCCLALALQHCGLKIILIDQKASQDKSFSFSDMRSLALSYTSQLFLTEIGIWKNIQPFATPIEKIYISEEKKFGKTHLDAKKIGVENFGQVVPLVYLLESLQTALGECKKNLTLLQGVKITEINYNQINSSELYWTVKTDHSSQAVINTDLVLAADGEHSFIREYLNIGSEKIDYHQTAIVSSMSVSISHNNTAYERFMSDSSVLAVLPRKNNQVGIIWTTDNKNTDTFKHYFLEKTQAAMGYKLGKFSLTGDIQTYLLKYLQAQQQTLPGLFLLGNAAHVLHPVAAQGFNLGLKDVSVLVNLIKKNTAEKFSPDFLINLSKDYLVLRQKDQISHQRFTHYLIKLFMPRNKLLSCLRSSGLLAFDFMPPLKRTFCLKRMGLIQDDYL